MPTIEGARHRLGAEAGASGNLTGYGPFLSAGVPASGYQNGTAEKGALVINTVTGVLYINTGTKAATVYTVVGAQV